MSLRNPTHQPATFALDVARTFELPAGAAAAYQLRSPWSEDAAQPVLEVRSGQPATIRLPPFHCLVFEATPVR